MEYKEIIFFIKLKFIIGFSNLFVHSIFRAFVLLIGVDLAIVQNISNRFKQDFEISLKWILYKKKRKENLSLSSLLSPWPNSFWPRSRPKLCRWPAPRPPLIFFPLSTGPRPPVFPFHFQTLTVRPHLAVARPLPSSSQRREPHGIGWDRTRFLGIPCQGSKPRPIKLGARPRAPLWPSIAPRETLATLSIEFRISPASFPSSPYGYPFLLLPGPRKATIPDSR